MANKQYYFTGKMTKGTSMHRVALSKVCTARHGYKTAIDGSYSADATLAKHLLSSLYIYLQPSFCYISDFM